MTSVTSVPPLVTSVTSVTPLVTSVTPLVTSGTSGTWVTREAGGAVAAVSPHRAVRRRRRELPEVKLRHLRGKSTNSWV